MELHDIETQKQIALEQALIYARELNETLAELRSVHRGLKEAYLDTVHRLAVAAEYRDGNTGSHIKRIGSYSQFIAEKMGLPKDTAVTIGYAAPMHDVGKIGIPDSILQKPGPLSRDEWDVIKTHPAIGANILSGSSSDILQSAELIALNHHERWDGQGYPHGLAGDDIPLEGRIVAIADVYDALRSQRPYKVPFMTEQVRTIISREKGKHFAPDIADLFIDCFNEIVEMEITTEV